MFTIGCHLSSAKGYLKMAQMRPPSMGTRSSSSRATARRQGHAIDPADVAAFHEFAGAHGITTFRPTRPTP